MADFTNALLIVNPVSGPGLAPRYARRVQRDLERRGLSVTRRDIGMVLQSYALFPHMTVEQNVGYGLTVLKTAPDEIRTRVRDVLQMVAMDGYQGRYPDELSGGQQQRVAVARAIVSQPKLVLADEPTANLDSTSAGQLMDLFRELNENHGVTFLIATHDERVMRRARRLIRMQDGRVISSSMVSPGWISGLPAGSPSSRYFRTFTLLEM